LQQVRYEISSVKNLIVVNIAEQRLQLREDDEVVMDVAIATAKKGMGEQSGSECTPRGWHQVRAMIGDNAPTNTVFIGRRSTGEVYSQKLRQAFPDRDWILTRILWLSGLERGKNRLGDVDTMRRFVYIHGCPDEDVMGVPSSHGCVKMRNNDVIKLFDAVAPGTRVLISENGLNDE
jgi:lipoprotein-anchoring transpeptidase ErfK/SrfK